MNHILSYKLFESKNPQTIDITNKIDDIFFEFTDDFNYERQVDEYIHEMPKLNNTLYGVNFVYPSESEKLYNRLPGIYNRNWKLGFIVKLSCANPDNIDVWALQHDLDTTFKRKQKVSKKRKLDIAKRKLESRFQSVNNLIKKKIRLIKRRIPEDIILIGVKNSSANSLSDYKYEFAFIYKEYKD